MKKHKVNLDLSYRNTIAGRIKSVLRIYRKLGLLTMLQKVYMHVYFMVRKIDFNPESIQNFSVIGENQKEGVTYVNTSWEVLIEIIKKLKIVETKIFDGTFIDFGSGKGGIVIQAKKLGFREVIGIEFAQKLCQISKSNIKKLLKGDSGIHIINDDASNYIPPSDTSVIFFYNPFTKKVMEPVIQNILTIDYLNDVFIIYVNPVLDEIITSNSQIILFEKNITKTGDLVHVYKIIKYYESKGA